MSASELPITPAQLRRHRCTTFVPLRPEVDARTAIQQADAAAWRLVRLTLTRGFAAEIDAAVAQAAAAGAERGG